MSARRIFWYCECGAQNHVSDSDCQFCDKHECYVTGDDWVKAGRPDDPSGLPCSRCGVPMQAERVS